MLRDSGHARSQGRGEQATGTPPTADDNNMCLRAAASYMDRTATEVDVADDDDPADRTDGPIEFMNTAVSAPTTPVRDAPTNDAPVFPEGAATVRYVNEDVMLEIEVGHPVTATDEDDDELKYTLTGADAASFKIGEGNGQLTTNAKLNYESKAEYRVMVTATDNAQTGPKSTSIEVTISVMDVDEKPVILSGALAITGPSRVSSYMEDGTGDVGSYSVSGAGDRAVSLTLTGTDRQDFRINNGVVTFANTPDFENPADQNRDNTYMFTVRATVGSGSDAETLERAVTVDVTNRNDPGTVSITPRAPGVGTELRATLVDDDGGETNERWQWARGAGSSYVDIAGATDETYVAVADDAGNYLRATVRYDDAAGRGRSEEGVTATQVSAAPQDLIADYNTNGVDGIQEDEAGEALFDYQDQKLTKEEFEQILFEYFFPG